MPPRARRPEMPARRAAEPRRSNCAAVGMDYRTAEIAPDSVRTLRAIRWGRRPDAYTAGAAFSE